MRSKNFIDMKGLVFGILTVIKIKGKDPRGNILWLCQCACGNSRVCRGEALRRGATKHCGKHPKVFSDKRPGRPSRATYEDDLDYDILETYDIEDVLKCL
jgi:hypothetical protein